MDGSVSRGAPASTSSAELPPASCERHSASASHLAAFLSASSRPSLHFVVSTSIHSSLNSLAHFFCHHIAVPAGPCPRESVPLDRVGVGIEEVHIILPLLSRKTAVSGGIGRREERVGSVVPAVADQRGDISMGPSDGLKSLFSSRPAT